MVNHLLPHPLVRNEGPTILEAIPKQSKAKQPALSSREKHRLHDSSRVNEAYRYLEGGPTLKAWQCILPKFSTRGSSAPCPSARLWSSYYLVQAFYFWAPMETQLADSKCPALIRQASGNGAASQERSDSSYDAKRGRCSFNIPRVKTGSTKIDGDQRRWKPTCAFDVGGLFGEKRFCALSACLADAGFCSLSLTSTTLSWLCSLELVGPWFV